MTIENLGRWCLAPGGVTEDIKRHDDLVKARLLKWAQAATDAAARPVSSSRGQSRA